MLQGLLSRKKLSIDNFGGYMTTCPELSNKTIPKKSHTNHRIVYNENRTNPLAKARGI